MKTKNNTQLLFGHLLTHTKHYQKTVGITNAKCEHNRLVNIMKKRKINHNSPFKNRK